MDVEVKVSKTNDTNFCVVGPVRSSLGRRTVTDLSAHTKPSRFGGVVAGGPDGKGGYDLQANCTIQDDEGRVFGLVIPQETLEALTEAYLLVAKNAEAMVK